MRPSASASRTARTPPRRSRRSAPWLGCFGRGRLQGTPAVSLASSSKTFGPIEPRFVCLRRSGSSRRTPNRFVVLGDSRALQGRGRSRRRDCSRSRLVQKARGGRRRDSSARGRGLLLPFARRDHVGRLADTEVAPEMVATFVLGVIGWMSRVRRSLPVGQLGEARWRHTPGRTRFLTALEPGRNWACPRGLGLTPGRASELFGRATERSRRSDERPPICPACGVTQGMVVTDDEPRFVCLECGEAPTPTRHPTAVLLLRYGRAERPIRCGSSASAPRVSRTQSAYSSKLPSNHVTCESPSKARMCVATRSRNQRSCEITTAQPAKSSSASSSARSVSTSRSFVGSSSSSRLPPRAQQLRQVDAVALAAREVADLASAGRSP